MSKFELSSWKFTSSKKANSFGENISTLNFDDSTWYNATTPSTVVGNLQEVGVYKNIYHDTNMKKIPGFKHGRKLHFAFYRMPEDSPFRDSWWYRTDFLLDKCENDKKVFLNLKGINYRANIWINGKRVESSAYISGAFSLHKIDISYYVHFGRKNIIAIELFAQQPDELGITFIDWNITPPDDSMGIWREVEIITSGNVTLDSPYVIAEPNLTSKDLVTNIRYIATVTNHSDKNIRAKLNISFLKENFKKNIELRPFETREIEINKSEFDAFALKNPKLWWPWQLGTPYLYSIESKIFEDEILSDVFENRFGVKKISFEINEHGAREFSINGKPLLLRGAAWTPDLLLHKDTNQDKIDIMQLKNMNMNTLRFEGMFGSDELWNICDEEGIIVFAGWPCCTHWEKWEKWKMDDYTVAEKSLRSQLKRLRNHASFSAWFYGSDYPPPENVEEIYLNILQKEAPHIPTVSNASARASEIQGKSGVKMSGPYGYVPPSYWYKKDMPGYADSFNTEAGPDVSISDAKTIREMLNEENYYVGSDAWNFHCGLASFPDTKVIDDALVEKYGKFNSVEEYVKKARVMAYETWRAMYEAYGRNFPKGTGIIGWMLNASWPSLLWQLYDYYNIPTGGYYGAQKGCNPVNIQYSYDDHSIWVTNYTPIRRDNLNVSVEICTIDGERIFNQKSLISLDEFSKKELTKVKQFEHNSSVLFLFLKLDNYRNVYWLGLDEEIYEESNSMKTWFYWPLKRHCSMKQLNNMKSTEIETDISTSETGLVKVKIKNKKKIPAFFLNITNNEKVIFWSENCITLKPYEEITVIGRHNSADGILNIKVDGWNLDD